MTEHRTAIVRGLGGEVGRSRGKGGWIRITKGDGHGHYLDSGDGFMSKQTYQIAHVKHVLLT